ncbi:hypothetical protein D3C86_1982600 [compost metagenome]
MNSSGIPVTGRPLVRLSEIPTRLVIVPRVIMNGETFSKDTPIPFTAPTSTPASKPPATDRPIAMPIDSG